MPSVSTPRLRAACLGLGLGLLAPLLGAQPRQPVSSVRAISTATRAPVEVASTPLHRLDTVPRRTLIPQLSPWWAPPLSAVVPGLGQGLLGQQRGVAYVAAEVYLILRALGAQRDARREREAYREIARTVARAGFSGDRPDGSWPYYERMQFVLESGEYNATPGGAFTPESDVATFNGSIWRLARETFWRDPDAAPPEGSDEYQRAIAFYQQRAVGDAFRWSWRDAQLEQDLYRQTIDRSNEASRLARQMVGVLLANHALSLVDAYVSVRLRVYGEGQGLEQRVGVRGSLPLRGLGR
jgi:hypothetical protein